VPCVNRNRDTGKVNLNANWHDNDNSDYSVPVSGEFSPTKEASIQALL
jgi:hypothetical protein